MYTPPWIHADDFKYYWSILPDKDRQIIRKVIAKYDSEMHGKRLEARVQKNVSNDRE